MRILELFSGSGSIGQAFRSKGWDVVSLDMDPKTEADIHEDILSWDHKAFPPGFFDAIWASPCCTQYSCARTNAKTPPKPGFSRLVGETVLGNHSLFQAEDLVPRKPYDRNVKR